MSLVITDGEMFSDQTRHTAQLRRFDGGSTWLVSWLPDRCLGRNQAITAMTIAEIVGGRGVGLSDDPVWPHIESFANELGLTGARAVVLASEPPEGPES
jgi:hypothetical protein